jgi:hypothetical protein
MNPASVLNVCEREREIIEEQLNSGMPQKQNILQNLLQNFFVQNKILQKFCQKGKTVDVSFPFRLVSMQAGEVSPPSQYDAKGRLLIVSRNGVDSSSWGRPKGSSKKASPYWKYFVRPPEAKEAICLYCWNTTAKTVEACMFY